MKQSLRFFKYLAAIKI